jgi:L-glyceraldehyde 3-phosphate reductase
MWPGPYGDGGSRKYLIASLDQSLRRMGLDYVDIFYSHRPDPETPIEETMAALDHAVRSGKALYAGISNYDPEQTKRAVEALRRLGAPCLLHQMKYSMFVRDPEEGLFERLQAEGVGAIAFSPLAQGLLTDRYLKGIPADSRAGKPDTFLKRREVTQDVLERARSLRKVARSRGQSLAQMSLAWVLRQPVMASALIGASCVEQIEECVAVLNNLEFSSAELDLIDAILGKNARA